MRFSERHGYKPPRSMIQLDSVDVALRNGLWNALQHHVWDVVFAEYDGLGRGFWGLSARENRHIRELCHALWRDYFREPLDTLSDNWEEARKKLRKFFFACEWFEVYDFIEFVIQNYSREAFRVGFVADCNHVLERELSAYRIVGESFSQVTHEEELAAIEEALQSPVNAVEAHLQRALQLMSDRKSPDFRNSIKESVSAVEALIVSVAGERGTLGQLLKRIEDQVGLHPALRSAFSSLYGYTSDADGIRHALMELNDLRQSDAKFFLVACSAFIGLVESKLASTNV